MAFHGQIIHILSENKIKICQDYLGKKMSCQLERWLAWIQYNRWLGWVMVFNDTFNNISVILVEKTGFVLLPISRVVLFILLPLRYSLKFIGTMSMVYGIGSFHVMIVVTSTFDVVLNNLVEICLGYTEQNISLKVNFHDIMF
jgi:hypothetical protein